MEKVKKIYNNNKDNYELLGYCVDVIKNKGKIFVLDKDYESFSDMLTDDDIILELSDKIQKQSTVIGGSELNYSLTLAGSGTYGGYTSFLTCGHGLNPMQTVKHSGITIGNVYVNVQGVGDYSIILAASGYSSTSSVYTTTTGYTTHFTGTLSAPAIGTYLLRYGRMSGQSYCQVTDSFITVDDRSYMYKAELLSGSAIPGDSGGPYRAAQNFCGVHYGASQSGQYVYFTPYSVIHSAGFTIKTN